MISRVKEIINNYKQGEVVLDISLLPLNKEFFICRLISNKPHNVSSIVEKYLGRRNYRLRSNKKQLNFRSSS